MAKLHTAVLSGLALCSLAALSPAHAVMIGAGTVSVANNYVPTVDLAMSPATYTANFGMTYETSGTGAFSAVTGLTGTMNGSIRFSSIVGTTIDQSLGNFFVFSDGRNGTYNFSVSSVRTDSYIDGSATTSAALYLLGTTLDANLGNDPTPTSLTVTFNNTGGSFFSSSETLAIPPAGTAVPEPASLAVLGVGVLAAASLRRIRRSA